MKFYITGSGKWLASVGLDDYRTIVIWDWKRGEKLASQRFEKLLPGKDFYGISSEDTMIKSFVYVGIRMMIIFLSLWVLNILNSGRKLVVE